MRKKLCDISNTYHMFIHFFIGIATGLVLNIFCGYNLSPVLIALLGVISIAPDAEHLVFFFTYGKRTNYTKEALESIKKAGFRGFVTFCNNNHKYQTSLYFHNAIVPIILIFLGSYYSYNQLLSAILFVLATHYIFDILEDFLVFGKLNPNWILKFNKKTR